MEKYCTPASSILFHMGMSGFPGDLNNLMNDSVSEGMQNATLYKFKLAKNIFAMSLVFNKFNYLGEVYNFFNPLDYKNPAIGVNLDFKRDLERYGEAPKKTFVDYRYKKYTEIDYSVLYSDKRDQNKLLIMFAINRKFIPMFSFFVYFLSIVFLIFNYRKNKKFAALSIFGFIIIVYSFAMSILPVAQERYRAVVDLFYFIPIGLMYSSFFNKNFWHKKSSFLFLALLSFCIFLNTLPLNSLYGFLRNIRIFFKLP